MEISSLQGMGKKMPLSSLAFTIGAFSLIGLPPFIGFPSKFLIIRSALERQSYLYTLFIGIVLLGTVIEAAYLFKIIQALYFKSDKSANEQVQREEAPVSALIPIFILMILILICWFLT